MRVRQRKVAIGLGGIFGVLFFGMGLAHLLRADPMWKTVDVFRYDSWAEGQSFASRLTELPDQLPPQTNFGLLEVGYDDGKIRNECVVVPGELRIRSNGGDWAATVLQTKGVCGGGVRFRQLVYDDRIVVAIGTEGRSGIAVGFVNFAVSIDGRAFQVIWGGPSNEMQRFTVCRPRFSFDPLIVVAGDYALAVSRGGESFVGETLEVTGGCLDLGGVRVVGNAMLVDATGHVVVRDGGPRKPSSWQTTLDGRVFSTSPDPNGHIRLWGTTDGCWWSIATPLRLAKDPDDTERSGANVQVEWGHLTLGSDRQQSYRTSLPIRGARFESGSPPGWPSTCSP